MCESRVLTNVSWLPLGAILFTLFGGFVAYQTTTLRFTSTEDTFSLAKSDGGSIGENLVVGGDNSWKYKSFVNYAFLPSQDFPILVYFKEIQTPVENRVEAPIVVDNLEGQAHFFPAIGMYAPYTARILVDSHCFVCELKRMWLLLKLSLRATVVRMFCEAIVSSGITVLSAAV